MSHPWRCRSRFRRPVCRRRRRREVVVTASSTERVGNAAPDEGVVERRPRRVLHPGQRVGALAESGSGCEATGQRTRRKRGTGPEGGRFLAARSVGCSYRFVLVGDFAARQMSAPEDRTSLVALARYFPGWSFSLVL